MSRAEPDQAHPSIALQRAAGRVAAVVAADGVRTRLARLHQSGCLKLRFPRLPTEGLEAILINTAGGLTGGDRLTQAFEAGAGSALTVTTQSCERIYRAGTGTAEATSRLVVGEGASLRFLPQETILFDGGRLRRRLEIDLAASSRLLLCESVILGRGAMGETVRRGLFRDAWRVRRDGRLVFADETRFEGAVDDLGSRRATLAGNRAFATILSQAPQSEGLLGDIRGRVGRLGGASLVGGFLVARILAPTGFELRRRLVPVLEALVSGPLPRVWSL